MPAKKSCQCHVGLDFFFEEYWLCIYSKESLSKATQFSTF